MKKSVGILTVSLAVLAWISVGIYSYNTEPSVIYPKSVAEYAKTSVKVISKNKASGGSGVIIRSTKEASYILTNSHVCQIIQQGGTIETSGKTYAVFQYKLYAKHDLCIIKVKADLQVTTVLARKDAPLYSGATISGHPSLLPHVVTEGAFSNRMTIEIMTSTKPCDGTESGEEGVMCMFYGMKAVVKKFKSQLVTALIMPGSSGSGVFNERGELTGVVFAGSQGLSYAFIVPFDYVNDFLQSHNKTKWRNVNPKAEPKEFLIYRNRVGISLWTESWM